MFQDEMRSVKPIDLHELERYGRGGQGNIPVIEDLASHDMSSDSPAILVTFLAQPVMPKGLCVKVIGLVGRMVDVRLGTFEEEEAMVVHKL